MTHKLVHFLQVVLDLLYSNHSLYDLNILLLIYATIVIDLLTGSGVVGNFFCGNASMALL